MDGFEKMMAAVRRLREERQDRDKIQPVSALPAPTEPGPGDAIGERDDHENL